MRTGAIFARGSCRALKWMALLGVVLALGAGTALAQITVTGSTTVTEGNTAEYTVTVRGYIDTSAAAGTVTVTLGTPAPDTTVAALAGDTEDISGNSRLSYTVPVPEGPATGRTLFTAEGTIEVRTTTDADAEDEKFTLAFSLGGAGGLYDAATGGAVIAALATGSPTALTIEDAETQVYRLTVTTDDPKEGAPIDATLTSEYPHEDSTVAVALEISDHIGGSLTDYSLTVTAAGTNDGTSVAGNVVTLGSGAGGTDSATAADVTITTPGNDKNRVADTIMLTASTAVGGARVVHDSTPITVADIHMLPTDITVTAYDMEEDGTPVMSVAAGGTVYLEVEADRGDDGYPMGEALTVALSLSDDSLATLGAGADDVTVPTGTRETPAESRIELTAAASNRVTPGMLRVNLVAKGADDATNGPSGDGEMGTPLSLTITQPGEKLIAAKSEMAVNDAVAAAMATGAGDNGFNPGESFMLDPSDLFELTAAGMAGGYALELSAATSDDRTKVGAGQINGMARVEATAVGDANVTITARATMPSSATIVDQALLGEAQIVIPVSVVAVPADPMPPGMPTNLEAEAGDEQVMLSWAAPAPSSGGTPTGYQYRVTTAGVSGAWMPDPAQTGATATVTGLENGTEYTFEVRAVNADGEGPAASTKATPVAPTVDPVAPSAPQNLMADADDGQVMLSWEAPATGDDPTGYQFRSSVDNRWSDWAATSSMTAHTVMGLTNGKEYTFEVRAMNAAGNGPAASATATPMAAPTRAKRGQITEFELIGAVEEKTIAGVKRLFVDEGEQNVELSVTVQWTHEEIAQIGYDREQFVNVRIKENRAAGPPAGGGNWLSWIDYEGDVHFPQSIRRNSGYGRLGGWIVVKTPKLSAIPPAQRGSARHVKSSTAKLPVLVLHDNHEAENDAFYIEAEHSPFGDVDLDATAAVNRITPEVVIDDDEEQKVTVKGPTSVYESDGTTEFTLGANPQRVELPLDVVLEMLDLEGTTVSAAQISVSDTSVQIGTGASAPKVTVHLPASDGNRVNNDYQMQASVNLYSLTSGGFDTIKSTSAPIKVVDVHKLPWLTVSPASGTVAEGGTLELTLNVNRNPADTIATDPEKRQYTSEALTIMVTAGGNASSSDFTMTPSSISVEEYKHTAAKNWMQEVTVTIAASADEDIDAETLMLDFVAHGTKAENGPRPDGDTNSVAQANLTIQDATATLVSVRENAYDVIKGALGDPPMLTTGMSAELMGVNLFDYDSAAVSVAYATSVEGGAVTASASGGTVTIMGAMAGEAKVTITATATPTSSSLVVDQTKANVAQMTFPVMVEDEDLVFMVAGTDDTNLTEGGMGGMVTVSTNRPVTANTEVMLMRDGSSSAGDDDFMLDPPLITIMAGQKEGSTMVMATEDNMAEEMELLTLFLVVDGMQMTDKSVSFYIWDAAVPALPVIGQLLLAALMAVGGYRRYRRR